MRVRDKIFPEGTKTRKVLRASAHILKGFKPNNVSTVIYHLKKDGLKKTVRKVKGIVFGEPQYDDENKIYQALIKHNEPTKAQLEEQRKTKFKIEPKISILVPMYNTPYKFFKELVD